MTARRTVGVFTSSSPSVASVDVQSGYVTAKGSGSAKITARINNGIEETCMAEVGPPAASDIKLNKKSLIAEQGKTKKLTATLSPVGATGKITSKSSNPKVASVKNGVVKGLKNGKVTVTAKLSSKIYAKCKVTVPIKPVSIRLNKKKLQLTIGQKYKLDYNFSPKGAKSEISWSSSRKEIASVSKSGNITAKKGSSNPEVASVGQNGLITANSMGTVEITVSTANGKSHTVELAVRQIEVQYFTISAGKQPFLKEGESLTIETEIYPDDTGKPVVLSVSDPSVAAITQDGVVKAVKAGKTTVYASVGSLTASCQITVTKGTWIDISKGVEILEDRSAKVNGNTIVPYDEKNGFTFVQSNQKEGGRTIEINSKEDIFITLSGVNIEKGYLWMKYAGNVTLELAEGTENRIAYVDDQITLSPIMYGQTLVYGFPDADGPYLTIQGKGKLILESNSPALGSTDIKIKSGEIIARTTGTQVPVIGSDASACANIYILIGAKVMAYGGCKAVGAPEKYKEQNINVAEGSLTYSP